MRNVPKRPINAMWGAPRFRSIVRFSAPTRREWEQVRLNCLIALLPFLHKYGPLKLHWWPHDNSKL
jgi:hypothetical protein